MPILCVLAQFFRPHSQHEHLPHESTRPLNLGHGWQAAGMNTRSSESSVTCWQENVPICWRSFLKSMPLQTLLMSWSISRRSAQPTDWCAHHLSQGMPRRSRKVCVHSACAAQPWEHRPCPGIWKIWKIWNWLSQTWNCWWKPSLRRPKKWRLWGFLFDHVWSCLISLFLFSNRATCFKGDVATFPHVSPFWASFLYKLSYRVARASVICTKARKSHMAKGQINRQCDSLALSIFATRSEVLCKHRAELACIALLQSLRM